jgi:hypothetical protein
VATLAQRASQRSAAGGLSAAAVDHINHLNSALMIASAVMAFVLPFELLLFSYAVLGPLHYLTEISWLHDRGYFTTGRRDFVPLIVLTVLAFAVDGTEAARWTGFIFLAFGLSFGLAFLETTRQKIWLALACVLVSPLVHAFEPTAVLFTVLLVTVIHVYVFTGVFILQGSFKSGRASGFVSFAIFLTCGITLLVHRPPAGDYQLGSYTAANVDAFLPLIEPLAQWTWVPEGNRDGLIAVGRFLGFAYTYHYLNWFSKTGIIRWHEVSRRRLTVIAIVYAASLALYAWSYALGLIALLFLSLLHVLLEFPLDMRAMADVGRAVGRLPAGAVAERTRAR